MPTAAARPRRASTPTWSNRPTSKRCSKCSRSKGAVPALPADQEAFMPQTRGSTTESLPGRQLLAALRAFRRGEFDVRLPQDLTGVDGQICESFNDLATYCGALSAEVADLRVQVGREGRTHRRLGKHGARGGWVNYVNGVNELLDDVTTHTGEVARVLSAVVTGDLSQSID